MALAMVSGWGLDFLFGTVETRCPKCRDMTLKLQHRRRFYDPFVYKCSKCGHQE
jgi:predicted RNA-binding Zn-ribbon protein involved in translation (DUF1610 family)